MRFTPQIETALGNLPISRANLIVDASFEDTDDAVAFNTVLRQTVGGSGTIVMAAFTNAHTLVDESEAPVPFHADLHVSPSLGVVPEVFRREANVLRSGHPSHSCAAIGQRAHDVLSTHRDNNPLGPIKKLNVLNGLALLVGSSFRQFTPIHLAEALSTPELRFRGSASRINLAGYEERVIVEHAASCTAGFDSLRDAVAPTALSAHQFGSGFIQLYPLRDLVRTASAAITAAPESLLCDSDECRDCNLRRAATDKAG